MSDVAYSECIYGPDEIYPAYTYKCTNCDERFYGEKDLTFHFCPFCGCRFIEKDTQALLNSSVEEFACDHNLPSSDEIMGFLRRQRKLDGVES